MYLNVNNRELATILAALRYWQHKGIEGPTKPHCLAEWDIAADNGTHIPLDANEIDALCERVNCDDDLPAQLLAALERAVEDCESRNKGEEADYGWVSEAETAIAAAKAAGIKRQT